MQLRIEKPGPRSAFHGATIIPTMGVAGKSRGYRQTFWGKMGAIKHAILRNEAKFREGRFFKQVAVGQAIVMEFWPYLRRATLKNEANFCICDLRPLQNPLTCESSNFYPRLLEGNCAEQCSALQLNLAFCRGLDLQLPNPGQNPA
jgi:hypothetical protein